MKRFLVATALIVLGVWSWQVPSAQADEKKQAGNDVISDQSFVAKASLAGLAEVEFGKLGTERATNDQVKKFAQRMVTDHTRANMELKRLATNKGYTCADQLDQKHRMVAERLATFTGPAFDREFMSQMLKDHKEAVSLFSAEAKNGKDEDLRAWATKTLPILKQHLEMARELAQQQKVNPAG